MFIELGEASAPRDRAPVTRADHSPRATPRRRWLASSVFAIALVAPMDAAAQDAGALPAARSAAPARPIDSPSEEAVITKAPCASQSGAGRAKLTIAGRRDVTSRFRTKGGALVARLTTGDGVRYGRNHLFVLSERAGRRARSHGRSFFLVRRRAGLVRLKLGADPPLSAGSTSRAPEAILAWARREFQARLAERPACRALRFEPQETRLSFKLSATTGPDGKNTLRARWSTRWQAGTQVERHFVVRRTAPLASAGRDQDARPRRRLRLGGTALAAKGGVLRYRWTLVREPRGCARRFGPHERTAAADPDRPGRYVARQVVTEHRRTARGARTAQVGRRRSTTSGSPPPRSRPWSGSRPTPAADAVHTVGGANYPLTSNPALGR